jgi:hypothetical protein
MDYKMIYLARRNPSCKAEDWPRHWRSHAVYCSQFPAIGAPISSLHYCSRQLKPTLDGAPFDPPGVANYDGVAVVASKSADSFSDYDLPRDLRDKIDVDETRVFSTLTPNFTFLSEETLVLGDKPGSAAVIRFLSRHAGGSREDFLGHLGGATFITASEKIPPRGFRSMPSSKRGSRAPRTQRGRLLTRLLRRC